MGYFNVMCVCVHAAIQNHKASLKLQAALNQSKYPVKWHEFNIKENKSINLKHS